MRRRAVGRLAVHPHLPSVIPGRLEATVLQFVMAFVGPVESLKVSTRWGCNPNARQIREIAD